MTQRRFFKYIPVAGLVLWGLVACASSQSNSAQSNSAQSDPAQSASIPADHKFMGGTQIEEGVCVEMFHKPDPGMSGMRSKILTTRCPRENILEQCYGGDRKSSMVLFVYREDKLPKLRKECKKLQKSFSHSEK